MKTHPYIKHNRRTNTWSVYAFIGNKRKVIARVGNETAALNIMDQAKAGTINTTRYPNYSISNSSTTKPKDRPIVVLQQTPPLETLPQ